MQPVRKFLRRFFLVRDRLLLAFQTAWGRHANRRTSIIAALFGVLAFLIYVYFVQPPRVFPLQRLVTIEEGASLSEIAKSLESKQIVRSALMLELIVTAMGNEGSVHAGDYLFKTPENVFQVARTISVGAYGLEPVRFRVVEGSMVIQMARMFEGQLERFNVERFLERALPQEGYLYPDTYFFLPNATDELVLRTLRQNFDTQTTSIAPQIASSSRSLSDIITMASIIEREAHIFEDRKMIAGVLWNRLDRGMPLQVDAVFLYTLGKATFDLTTEDLTTDAPYNTYTRKGLPPTPIGSPSMDSVMAALEPTKNSYLYYLADNTGVTHYSKTYAEHLRKKALYLGD